MEELVARARITMFLMLLGVGSLVWSAFEETVDIVGLGNTIAINSIWVQSGIKPQILKDYHGYYLNGNTPFDPNALIGALLVEDLLEMRRGIKGVDLEDLYEAGYTEVAEEFVALETALGELESAYSSSGLDAKASLRRLEHASKAQIKIPLLGTSISADRALLAWVATFVLLCLYLLSLSTTMRVRAPLVENDKGCSFVFFHSGRLGLAIGLAWVASPAIAVLVSTMKGVGSAVWGGIGGLSLAGIAVLISSRLLATRTHFLHRLAEVTDVDSVS